MKDDYDLNSLISTKKKRKNSRTKGNTFERKVAEILNNAFNTQEFMRSPGSGAFATTHKLPDHLKLSGDLLTPLKFKFSVECKVGYNKESIDSWFKDTSDLNNFITQAERDARKMSKKSLVVWKQDRKEVLCLFEQGDNFFFEACLTQSKFKYIKLEDSNKESSSYIICKLEDLLSLTKDRLSCWFD